MKCNLTKYSGIASQFKKSNLFKIKHSCFHITPLERRKTNCPSENDIPVQRDKCEQYNSHTM